MKKKAVSVLLAISMLAAGMMGCGYRGFIRRCGN